MDIGLLVPVPGMNPELSTLLSEIECADDAGFASGWMPNIRGFDALTVLALAGPRTRSIELGTAVVPTYPRHPAALAQQALTVQVATGGRLALGIGLSHRVTMEQGLGFDWSHPIRHMREYLTCLRGLLAGEAVQFEGEEFHLASYRLEVPGASPPPILVAALGPQMLKLAGRLADGTITWVGGPRYLSQTAVPLIGSGARDHDRPAPRIVAGLPVCVTDDAEAARAFAARFFRRYGELPSYRAVLDREGAEGPADVALVGDEEAVTGALRELAEAGATDLIAAVFSPPGEESQRTYRLLASARDLTTNPIA